MMTLLAALLVPIGFAPDVDKEDVRKLLAAGVSESTIVEFIRKNGPATPLSIEDITELKKAGAGDAVLNAMLESSRTSDAVTRAQSDPELASGTVVHRYYHSPYYVYPYPNYYYSYRPYYYRYYRPYPRYYHPPYSSYRPSYPHRYSHRYDPPRTRAAPPPRTGVDRYRR